MAKKSAYDIWSEIMGDTTPANETNETASQEWVNDLPESGRNVVRLGESIGKSILGDREEARSNKAEKQLPFAKKDGIPINLLADEEERENARQEVVKNTTLWSDDYDQAMQNVVDTKRNRARMQLASQGISIIGNEAVDNYLAYDSEFSKVNFDNIEIAKSIADAKASNVEANDITAGLNRYDKEMKTGSTFELGNDTPIYDNEAVKRVAENDGRYNVEDTLNHFKRMDEEGRNYYEFNGKRLYSAPQARAIVKEFVDEHNHWIDMKDPDFREAWAQKEFGVSFNTYVDRMVKEDLEPLMRRIEKSFNELPEDVNLPTLADEMPTQTDRDRQATAIGQLKRMTESLRNPSFWNGMAEGFMPMLQNMAGDWGDILVTQEQNKALEKSLNGEALTQEEWMLVDMFEYEQKLQEMQGKFRPNFDANKFASGALQSAGWAANIMLEGALLGGGYFLKEGAEKTVKEAFEQGMKTSLKEGMKQATKVAGRQALSRSADDAVKVLANANTYRGYADRRQQQYSFVDGSLMKKETNPFADFYRAYMDAYSERLGEAGGDFINDGFEILGRAVAQTRSFGKVAKPMMKVMDYAPVATIRQGLRQARVQNFAGEVFGEYMTSALQPLMSGDLFTTWSEDGYSAAIDKHYSELLSKDTALSTIAICGAMSGAGTVVQLGLGIYAGIEINSLNNKVRKALEDISDEALRNEVYLAINNNDYSALAKFNWAGIDEMKDIRNATSAIFSSAKAHYIKGELSEVERINTFMPIVQNTIESCYMGADMGNPKPTTDIISLIDSQGQSVGNVMFGNLEDADATLTIRRNDGQTVNISRAELAQQGITINRTSVGSYIAEQYALMFGKDIAKERLAEVMDNVRGYRNMSEEAQAQVLKDNGFSVHKTGEVVTLADGRQGIISGESYNGYYGVEVTDANGKPAKLWVGFESILSNDPDMAQAQVEAMAEGSIETPVALPTDEKGNIKLNEIENGKTLAMVLPAQLGSKHYAVAAIDAELARLDAEGEKAGKSKAEGLDAIAEAKKKAEARARRISALEDARKRLTGEAREVVKTAEAIAEERNARQAEKDAMSTFDFSRDYRSRMDNTRTSRNALINFLNNISKGLGVIDSAIEETDKQIGKVEAQIGNAYESAMSEADVERIAEETKGLQTKLDTLKAEKAEMETERKKMQHRKAQYEQTLKDMGATEVVEGFQEGEIGGDKEFKALVEKASEALGLPIIVTNEPFVNSRQNGMHRVSKDGNAIYINSRSTKTEQSVGILAHEIVHEFKQFLTPEEWAKFEDVIMTARFGKDWANSEAYKKEIESIQDAERKSGHTQGVSDDKAREEAVAYAIQDYIFNGADGVRAFEAIVNQDLNWRDKLMEALRKVVDKLKSLFGKLDAEQSKAVQEAIAEFENVFKRYAQKSGEIKAEQIEGETAAIINEKDGQSSFSLSTYEDGGRDILQNFLTSQVEGGKLDQKDANAILTEMDAIYDICMDYKDEYTPFGAWSDAAVVRDGEGMPVFSVIKANGDYAMNLDFSLVCKKRRTLDAVLNEMIGRKLIEIAPDDPTFIAKVNDIVRKYGFETACRLCFVDAKRFRVVSTARNFCKLYNGVVAKLMPTDKKVAINSFDAAGVGYPTHEGSLDTLADSELNIKALEDILKRNGEKTVIAKIARHLLEHPEDRKLVHISDFVSTRGFDPTKALNPQILSLYNSKKGSGGPKASFSDVQYLNDVIYADWNKEDAYAVGGVRVQSFSDYVPRMVFDYMQMVADLAAKQMPVHAYTKEAAFAKTFGLTGMKINMSLVPTVVEGGIAAGLDADGNYAWEEGETFDYDTAIEIQNADGYRENCGTIAVGVSDEHIDKMLDDDNIRMVIPYHKSRLNKAVAIANNIDAFKDYTNQQNTRYADGTKLSSADSKNVPNFNEDTRRLGDPRKAADAYLAWCKENNYKPKFDKWASHPNYYKLLEDFTTLVDGEYFEQRGVTMTFPKEGDAFGSLSNLIAESLEEDAVLEGKRDSLVGAMVDEIESTLFSNREKALESSNSLQKQPNTQGVVSEADIVESYSIDRSQYLEGLEDDRAFASRQMDKIEENVKKNNPFGVALTIDDYDKFATDSEKKLSQGKMSAIDAKYAQENIKTYRAIANYGRAVLAEQFPDYAANAHANNLKSGKTNLAMIRGLFQEYNSNEHMAELFDLVSSVAEKFGTKFRLATLKGNFLGHQRGNLVEYKIATLNSGTISDQDKARIILHEMIHAATSQGVELCENARLREMLNVYPSTKLRTSVRRLKTLLEDIRSNEEFKGEYGITDVHEMLAELSNPRFVEKLKKHDIWTRIVDGIREIASAIINMVTGKDVAKSDAYNEVRTTLTEIIEETPMEFIEGLNRLRDAGRIKGVKPLEAESVEEIAEPRTEQESFSILRSEDTDTIFATAKEEFASTNDWLKTGWLMPDGTQLDFAEGGDYRGTDHRAIGQAYKGVAEHQWQYLQDFENRGGIRIHMNRDGKYGTIEMTIKPTAEQKKRLRSFIGAVSGNVDVDFMDENYNTAHSASYEGVSPARVLSGITNFYDEGIKPKGNVSYSVSREDAKLKDGVRAILDEYNNEGMQYRSEIDVANGVEALINGYEGDATELENILNDFRMAQDDARAWGNRMDSGGEEVFMDALNAWVNSKGDVSESYSISKDELQIFLPEVEYAILSSEISDRQFHEHRPSFDFAYTYHNFYVYTYLDYGNFVVNFAANIEVDRELINLILKGFRNGTIYSPRTLNSLFEEIQSRRERYSGDILDAVKEYLGNGIISTLLRGSKSNEAGGVPEDGSHRSEEVTNGGEDRQSVSLENSTKDSYSLNRNDIDYLDAVNRGDIETDSFSLNRNSLTTIATPAVVAGANPSDATRDKIDALRNEIEERIDRIATTKNVTFEEIEKMMLDESDESEDIRKWVNEYNRASRKKDAQEKEAGQKAAEDALQQKFGLSIKEAKRKVSEAGTFMTAIQKSAKNRYNRIIKAVVASLKASPSRGVMGEDVAIWVRRAMTQVYLDVADANLKATQRDVKSILTKEYEKKNSKGEKEGKLVDYVAANIVEQTQSFVKQFYQRINEKGDTVIDLGNPTLLWKGVSRPDVNAEIDRLAAELDGLQKEYDKAENANASEDELNKIKEKMQICEGVLELLDEFRIMCSIAEDIAGTENNIKEVRNERNELRNTEWRNIYKAKTLVQSYNDGKIDAQKALTELQKLGYGDVAEAQQAIDGYEQRLENKKSEIFALQRQLASEKLALLDATKDFNTAVYGIEAVGRIAFKEEKENLKKQKAEWRAGILRSVRNPLFANTADYDEENKRIKNANGKKYSWWDNARLRSRGDAFTKDMTDTLEFVARKMDVMSIPNAWLHTGLYYQFILHPEFGVLARADWRYFAERQVRAMLDLKVASKTGYKSVDKLRRVLNKDLGIAFDLAATDKDGKVKAEADTSNHKFTVDEALYIRAVIRQEGVLGGYYTIGLDKDKIDQIVAEVERKYPRLCDLADWVQGEDGIYERLYTMNNEVYRKKNGRDLDHNPHYCPIRRKSNTVPTESNLGDAISVSRLANGIGSNKKRVRNNIAMDVNARFFGVLDEHIGDVIQWIAYADLFDKMNTLLGSPMFKKMMQVQGISKTNLENCFLRAAGERLGEGETGGMAKVVNALAKNAVASNVVGNLNSAMKQFVGITAALSTNISPEIYWHFVKNFPLITNMTTIVEKGWRKLKNDDIHKEMDVVRGNYVWALKNIPTFAERVDTGSMGMDIFQRDSFRTWDKVAGFCKKYGMAANKFMDIIVSASVAKTVYEMEYKKLRRRGMTHEQAHDDARFMASVLVNQTQQSDQGAFLSAMQSDRKGLAGTIASTTLTAYNNNQFAMDRNARAAMLNLLSLGTDGGNKQRVEMLAKEYEERGLTPAKAKRWAKWDLWSALLAQAKILLHNTTINPIVWAFTPNVIGMLTLQIASVVWGDDDDNEDESIDIIIEKQLKEFADKVLERGWVYLLPMSNIVGVKDFADAYFDKGGEAKWQDLLGGKSLAITQPLANFLATTIRYSKSKDASKSIFGEANPESQVTGLGFTLSLIDLITRYGLGVSTKTLARMGEGLYDSITRGNVEDFMNATTQSGVLTKLYASAIREDEKDNLNAYIERRAGVEKIVSGYSKGVDMRRFEREYADRMDEIMSHNTDFDYDKFKEDKKTVGGIMSNLHIGGDYMLKPYATTPTPEVRWAEVWMTAQKSVANTLYSTVLPAIQNWDEDNVANRSGIYRKIQDRYDAINEVYNADNMQSALESIKRITLQQQIEELTNKYVDYKGRPTRSEAEIQREAESKVEKLMRDREEYIKEMQQNKQE